MSNGNVFERLWKLATAANKLVLDGKRDPEDLCNLLQLFIEQKQQTRVWKTWKTIKLGTGLRSASDFKKAITGSGAEIGDWGNMIICNPAFTAAVSETEVELVLPSVAELGFKKGATLKDIYARAEALGLDLCPSEVGPQLLLQDTVRPKKNEWFVVAMEPVACSDGVFRLFLLEHDGVVRWLSADHGFSDNFWRGSTRFVFLRRKQSPLVASAKL